MAFKTEPLEQVCDLVIDCPHSTPTWLDEGIVVIRNTNIRNGRLDFSKPSFTNEENYLYRSKRAEIQENDIIFTREAPMGEVCIIPEGLKACVGQRQVLLRAGNDINPKYLFYALQSPYVQHQVSWNEGTGTTVSNIRIPFLKQFLIPRNENSEDQIAHILSTLDDKIELNRKMNQTLEAMAQALFKSWFVDFDPVHVKVNAKSDAELDAVVTELGISKEVLELFPSEFVESEMEMIPKGWEVAAIGDCFTLLGGFAFKSTSYDDEGEFGLVTIKNVQDGKFIEKCANHIAEIPDKMKAYCELQSGDTLLSLTGNVGRICIVTNGKYLLNQRVSKIIAKDDIPSSFAYFYFRLPQVYKEIIGIAKGTAQLNLSPIETTKLTMIRPSSNILSSVADIFDNIFNEILANNNQTQTLQQTRDTLLPKLLSGKLNVSTLKIGKEDA